MKKILLILLILLTPTINLVYAEDVIPEPVGIHLTITTNDDTLYDQDITVNACDSDNPSSSILKVTAYCAILQSGTETDWNFSWAPGIFLNSINDISGYTTKDAENNDVYHYWSWYLNSSEGSVGLNQYELKSGDLISLTFIDPVEETEEPAEEPQRTTGSIVSSSRTKTLETKKIFDIKKGFEFLISEQKENGSFGENIYTDWSALAIATNEDYQNQKTNLVNYLKENKTGTLLTDYERYAMALMSLNINPYNVNNENYIKKITDSFDGKQFGDIEKDNDDIFALIVLQNAGYKQEDSIIKNTITYILSKQKEDGSWDNSVDMTGAGIESLSTFNQNEQVKNAVTKAKEFLKQKQEDNGGWNNISSTAWAIEGILALAEKPEDWIKNNNSPIDYLAKNQDADGGIEEENIQNKIWQTAYVLSALSGKTWNQIMQNFEKSNPTSNAFSIANAGGEEIKESLKNSSKITTIKKPALENLKKTDLKISEPIITEPQPINTEIKTEKNWFKNLINKIFSIF